MLKVAFEHAFGDTRLAVDLDFSDGVTALFGRSGAGKSTVLHVISGLLTPDTGKVTLNGEPLLNAQRNIPPHKRRMGFVFQDARLFPHMTVAQNIDYGARFTRLSPNISKGEVIDLLGLDALLNRKPNTLSGGERQRVALARALLCAPRLLLMDEPLAALDTQRKAEILPYLERLKSTARLPIIYVSHSMDEIARLADHIVVMRDGHVTTTGPIFDVLADPKAIPHLGVRDAGAILTAKVASRGEDGLTQLALGSGHIELPGVSAPLGEDVRLRILAQDVILSLDPPQGLSAMNILRVEITDIHEGAGPGAAVQLAAGGQHLLARITRRSVARMGLQKGLTCYAIVKAMAVAPGDIGQA